MRIQSDKFEFFEVGYDFSKWAFLLDVESCYGIGTVTFLCFYVYWAKK